MIYILFLVHLSLIRYPPYVPEPGFNGMHRRQRSAGKRVMGVAQIHNTPRSAQLMVGTLQRSRRLGDSNGMLKDN